MRIIYFFILVALSFNVVGQRPAGAAGGGNTEVGNSKISGVIIDSVSTSVVEFAAVGLWSNGKAVDGTLTDDKGSFKFEGLKSGTYKLVLSFVGYKAKNVEGIVLKSNDQSLNLGKINLAGDNISLDEVTVTGQASLVEDKIDRLVYNADKDITNTGGTAEEVLRKVPMLSVDLDGNVEMRGSSNIRVLINNKPSSIFASSIGDALKQIPADQIKSVEVITSPGAKYDGEGTAGIVNILLKKNTFAGVTGNVSGGVGLLGSSINGSLNLRDVKWGLTLNGSGRYSYNFLVESENLRESYIDQVPTYLTQTSSNKGVWGRGRYSLAFDYDFDKKTSLTISLANGNRVNGGNGDLITTLLDANRATIYSNTRLIDQVSNGNSYDLDATFFKKYENPLKELSVAAQLSRSSRVNNYTAIQNNFPSDSSLNEGIDQEITLQLDYVHPIGEKSKWEMGAKGILRKATSEGDFYLYNTETGKYALSDLRSNFLDYDQDVIAAYNSFTLSLPKKWGLQIGLRYEQTIIRADFKDVPNADIPNYDNFLPSATLSKRFEKGSSIKLSYNQRIQRPSIRYLNPFIDYSNQNDISYGAPTLRPELVDQIELGYSTFFGRNSINFSLYNRYTDNSIERIRNVVRVNGIDITETTYGNIGINQRVGSNLSFNLMPTQKFRIGGGVNASYVYMDTRTISNDGMNYSFNLNTSYSFPKDWTAALFGFASLPSVELQGTRGGFYFHSFSVKKEINDKKGSFGLGIENPFAKSINIKSQFEDLSNPASYFIQSDIRRIYRRSIRLDFSYKFGKMDATKQRLFSRKKGVDNNDQLSGDDGNMM
ncbi:Outer membrane receptor proteins, mostly Fe transport [Spirosomataceae bacterium TFI 002]|nr:Outer membrane receptor proteins, mostly Fe transport [Spirosomataceae bacterium TFI 002]